MNLHGAGNGAHGARADSVLARGLEGRLAQLGMSRQAEVIVRGQIDHVLAVEGALRGLLVLEHAQFEMRALGFEFIELIGEVRKRIGARDGGHECLTNLLPQMNAGLQISV